MSFSKTSMTMLIALGFAAGIASSASACDWHNKQTLAKASPPTTEQQQADTTAASPIDPVILAKIEARDGAETIEQK